MADPTNRKECVRRRDASATCKKFVAKKGKNGHPPGGAQPDMAGRCAQIFWETTISHVKSLFCFLRPALRGFSSRSDAGPCENLNSRGASCDRIVSRKATAAHTADRGQPRRLRDCANSSCARLRFTRRLFLEGLERTGSSAPLASVVPCLVPSCSRSTLGDSNGGSASTAKMPENQNFAAWGDTAQY